jgi:Pilus formation protein N terminal region
MIRVVSKALALPMALVFASLATAAAAAPLTVAIDHSTRLNIAGAASSVVVGNPAVADVTVVDSHTVFISGRGYGETDLVVLDPVGRTLYSGEVLVGGVNDGRVSVYRGADRTDLACAPGCEVSFRSPNKSGGGSGAAGGSGGSAGGGSTTTSAATLIASTVRTVTQPAQ